MPRSANALPKRVGLPRHEWDFGDRQFLPDAEAESAYYWEFALETPEVIAEVGADRERLRRFEKRDVTAFRKWMEENPRPDFLDRSKLDDWVQKFYAANPDSDLRTKLDFPAHFLAHWPEFPELHWLEIPPYVRQDKKRIRLVPGQGDWRREMWKPHFWLKQEEGQEFDTVPSFFYKTGLGLACHTWIATYLPPGLDFWRDWTDTIQTPWGFASADRCHEYRLVKIAWARSDRKLKGDFARWLKDNRPPDRQPYHSSKESDSRRTTERDLLKALGALRLLCHFKGNWNAAADYSALFCTDKRGEPKALYVEQSEWLDAEKRAGEALSEFHRKLFSRKVFG